MNHILLTRDPLDVGAVMKLVSHNSCGCISLFVGTTRDNFDDKKVQSLEYEAYEPMAIKQMESICERLRAFWPDVVNVAIYHRLGMVAVREESVIIAVASPHRQSALHGVEFAIEELKKLVPIWKKEKYDDDESSWKENKECNWLTKAGVSAKRKRLDITSCSVQDSELVHQSLVQIAAEEQEIQRRIRCFVEKKRGVIDISNILDFTMIKRLPNYNYAADDAVELSEESTCARTNSAIVKQEHSKCHLRVRRVENCIGPQTRPDYTQALDNLMFLDSHKTKHRIKNEPRAHYGTITNKFQASSSALQERLIDVGEHLGIVNVPVGNQKQMYMLLKDMENRILHLESISPEYKNFSLERIVVPSKFIGPQIGTHQGASGNEYSMVKHNIYTVEDIESIIEEIEQSNDDSDKEQLQKLTLSIMS